MKKLITIVLSLMLLFFATVSCDDGDSTACQHDWVDAACTAPKTCKICNETIGEALGHTTTTGMCSRCGENFSSWELGEFVDEFNLPTGNKYISTTVYDGKFSNSATTNSKLAAAVQVTSTGVYIMLWEYGSSLVKGIFDTNEYSIIMLDTEGKKHYLSGTMYDGGTRVIVKYSDENTVIDALKQSGTVSFYLVYSKYTTSTYTFTVSTKGFYDLYNEL